MFNFKNKIVAVGLLCVMPTYVMGGSCQGKIKGNQIIASCNGIQTKQLSLTSIHKEIFLLNSEIFDEVLRGSDSLDEINGKLSMLNDAGKIIKENNNLIKENNINIKSLQAQLYQNNISKAEQRKLRQQLSYTKKRIKRIKEKNSNQLHILEGQLNYLKNKSNNLIALLTSTANAFSHSLGANFSHYKKCVQSNNILAQYTIPSIQKERQKSSFSSAGSFQYSQFFSDLSSSGISSYSLESCATEFKSLEDRFVLYEVALNLLISNDNRKREIVKNLFKEKRKHFTESNITRFIQNFKSFPKNQGLGNLIHLIDNYIQTNLRSK